VRDPWVRYVIALVAGAFLIIPAFAGVMVVLDRWGTMPPPLISNNLCVDEKLAFMRQHPPHEANLLVVGSSSALRHFNSPEAVRIDPELRPYNAGLCATNLWQDEQVIRWLTHRAPGIRRVLLVASSLEFGDCRPDPRPSLNFADVDRFVFGDTSRLGFYLKSFNPTTLLHNSVDMRRTRTDMTWFDSVVLNDFGDAPVQPPRERREWYLKAKLDERCFAVLRRTASALDARGVKFALVESPMNPNWREEFDRSGALTPLTRRKVWQAFSGTHAVLLEDQGGFSAADFYDAVHLRASSTPRFTRSVLSQLKVPAGGASTPSH